MFVTQTFEEVNVHARLLQNSTVIIALNVVTHPLFDFSLSLGFTFIFVNYSS